MASSIPPTNKLDFLPNQTSRLGLYLLLEKTVYRRIRSLHQLPDSSISINRGLSSIIKEEGPASGLEENCRDRQISYYRQTALPLLAAALHLKVAHDLQNQTASCLPQRHKCNIFKNNHDELVPCLTLLFSNIILLSKGKFDARIRSVVKEVVVPILKNLYIEEGEERPTITENIKPTWNVTMTTSQSLVKCNDGQDMLPSPKALYTFKEQIVTDSDKVVKDKKYITEEDQKEDWQNLRIELETTSLQIAMQQFEAMEKVIANNTLQTIMEQQAMANNAKGLPGTLIRGLQIGTVGLLAGGLFVMSGGLAAPGLLAISALVLGVVKGGGLAEYKMKLRSGLSEWRIRKENIHNGAATTTLQGLHAVVCVSGWLHSTQDFQQPWGVQANDPPLKDEVQLLEKFFSVFAPHKIPFCKPLLHSHSTGNHKGKKNEEKTLWCQLEEKYGRNPHQLLPFNKSQQEPSLRQETLAELDTFLQKVILQQAPVTESIYVENRMLIQMELMNAEIFVNLSTEMLEAIEKPEDVTEDEEGKDEIINLNEAFSVDGSSISDVNDDGSDESKEEKSTQNDNLNEDTANPNVSSHNEKSKPSSIRDITINNQTMKNDITTKEDENNKDYICTDLEDGEQLNYDWVSGVSTTEGKEINKLGEDVSQQTTVDTSDDDSIMREEGFTSDKSNLSIEGSISNEKSTQIPNYSHLVWDWEAHYSGELYTLTWETDNLLQLCRSLDAFFEEAIDQLSKEVIKQTANKEKVSDVPPPSAFSSYAKTVDNSYQLISYRSEKAGIELANCLLESDEGRPVSLVGFSFGARVIFSALLELAKHQTKWEQQQQHQHHQHHQHHQQSTPSFSIEQTAKGIFTKERPNLIKTLSWKPKEQPNLIKSLSWKSKERPNLMKSLSWKSEERPNLMKSLSWKSKERPNLMKSLSWKSKERPNLMKSLSWKSKERPNLMKSLSWKSKERPNLIKTLSRKLSNNSDSSNNENKSEENPAQNDETNNIIYKREPASLIEDVILIGMPSEINNEEWIRCRELVAGRLVNCYNKLDWVLSYMINSRCWNNPVQACGTHPIKMEGVVENYDISHLCSSSHGQYPLAMPNILHHIQFGAPCSQ